MSLSDEIRAKVDEAERRLEAGTRTPWDNADGAGGNRICGGKLMVGRAGSRDADLIVDCVNARRAQIEHARDVLERHEAHEWWTPDGPDEACTCGYMAWPCPEILSLAKAWGVEP